MWRNLRRLPYPYTEQHADQFLRLRRQHLGHGIITEAPRAVTAAALADPEIVRVYAPVFSWNAASMRVPQKAGCRQEAVLVRGGVRAGTVFDRVNFAITRDTGLPYVPYVAPP